MSEERIQPPVFGRLIQMGCMGEGDLRSTCDGFVAVQKSLADILAAKNITTFPNDKGEERRCEYFFDDWYLYAVGGDGEFAYSLFKMREQERDAELGRIADGDIPGVTVSFIEFHVQILLDCLENGEFDHRKRLNQEINRVVSMRNQHHDSRLKAYFLRTEAEGAYLIAECYVNFIAGLSVDGSIPVPVHYGQIYEKSLHAPKSRELKRLPAFIESNNAAAGHTVCDHRRIYLREPGNLTDCEKYAILATHTANVSFCSFAAEVQYHARFLLPAARISIPLVGSVYESAIRADMTIGDNEFEGPAPFHNMESACVRSQQLAHPEYGV